MDREERERIELDLLLEALYQGYGYDFRAYAPASIERRARRFLSSESEEHLAELIPRVLTDEEFTLRLVYSLSVPVTEMFRDPFVYKEIREHVVPMLRTYPSIKIWHAGCASGEEAYSMAILLQEEQLLERTTIYATDFNETALAQAREGIYPAKSFQEATRNYQEAGGAKSFSDYYCARYDSVVMDASLRKNITFSNHNLAVDGVFGEMHMVFCRNVLIYFNKDLRERVLDLFIDSLVGGGYLCLGTKENLHMTTAEQRFDSIDEGSHIFRKRRGYEQAY
jgi:chemotaxis protein methyltransferase CheR